MGYRMDIVKLESKIFHATRILDGLMDSLLKLNMTGKHSKNSTKPSLLSNLSLKSDIDIKIR